MSCVYSLESQYELPAKMVPHSAIKESQGRHFVRILPLHVTAPLQTSNRSAFLRVRDVTAVTTPLVSRLQAIGGTNFTFDANYRWSKSIDTTSFEGSCFCTNQSYPIEQKKNNEDLPILYVRHNFVMTGIWEIPYFENPCGRQLFGGCN